MTPSSSSAPPARMGRVVLALCAGEVLGMAGAFAFPALLPGFRAEWGLSNAEAGWISGIYLAGYALAVPALTAATDRIDAKRVWLLGAAITALAGFGFAIAAQGFWSAMALRALAGIGLAGMYMPGLKALVDRTEGARQPQWISWYTSSFSLGTSASFLAVGAVAERWDWHVAFALAAIAALLAIPLVALALAPAPPPPPAVKAPLLDFRPVLRNRPVFGYVLAYSAHTWELFGLRSWMVGFLVAVAALSPASPGLGPTTVATLASLLGIVGSIGGAALAVRFDRRRFCALAALLSAALGAGLGFTAIWPYGAVVALVLAQNLLVQLDSAALTTGAILEAEPGRRGATIAIHSLFGFGAAFLAPLAFGTVLDWSGGEWGPPFAALAAVAALGPLALRWRRPRPSG